MPMTYAMIIRQDNVNSLSPVKDYFFKKPFIITDVNFLTEGDGTCRFGLRKKNTVAHDRAAGNVCW